MERPCGGIRVKPGQGKSPYLICLPICVHLRLSFPISPIGGQKTQNNTPTKEELLARTELLALAIEVAFREKLYKLLTYLKMNEKREEMKLKETATQSKQREVVI